VLASGPAVQWALDAQRLLAEDWGVAADVWSVTSWNELRRDALACDEWNYLNPDSDRRVPYVTRKLEGAPGPVVAVSDFMRAVQDQIAQWVPQDWASLGTDGFGPLDTRGALRRHFTVDGAVHRRVDADRARAPGEVKPEAPREAIERYQLLDVRAAGAGNTLGES
jgi:pyruvate dehydrogenase E1 component